MTEITNLTVEPTIFAVADGIFAFPATISNTNVQTVNGKQIIPAGTVVGGSQDFMANENAILNVANDSTAQGILEHNLDVSNGTGSGTVVVQGYINENRIPAVSSDAKKALTKITFMKR